MDKIKTARIRYVEPNDLEYILKIENSNHIFKIDEESVKDPRSMSKMDFLDFIESSRTRLSVIELNDKIAGFLLMDVKDDKKAVIHRLSVEVRRSKCGSLLLDEAFKIARKAFSEKICAFVYEQDDSAIQFFKSKGFRGRSVRKHFDKKWDAIEFSKSIPKEIESLL